MYGTSVRWTEIAFCGADLEAELADRLEERQRLDVADGAADLDDQRRRWPSAHSRMRALISSVMCGITCTVPPRYSPRRSFWMTRLVDLAGGDVVQLATSAAR